MSLASRSLERAKKTKAYRQLKKADFVDKKTYINENSLDKLVPTDEFPPEFIYASSGSTGQANFWFRGKRQEAIGALIHERIVRDIWKIKKIDCTLVVICFSMGVWVAGNYTADSFRQLARRGYKLTVATPGIEQADILQLLARVAPLYKNIIIAGYPPFLMDIMGKVKKLISELFHQEIFFLTAGDKFSENWRSDLLRLIGQKERERIINVYGSADAGVMAYETPFTIFLREQLMTNDHLRQELSLIDTFTPSRPSSLPGLYEYDPNIIQFENLNEELVITANTIIPLVRYNTHDLGRILNQREMSAILKHHHLETEAQKYNFKKTGKNFVLLRGRSDVAVTFYALNIYPENIQAGLEDKRLAKYTTGDFKAYVAETRNSERQELRLEVELRNRVKSKPKLKKKVIEILAENLIKFNAEFRKLTNSIGKRALPKVSLVPIGIGPRIIKNKTLVFHHGKKPRLVVRKER